MRARPPCARAASSSSSQQVEPGAGSLIPLPRQRQGKASSPWQGSKGFLQLHPQGSLGDSPLFPIPWGLAFIPSERCWGSRTSVITVLPESSSDAWSLGTGEACRQGKRQIQDETLAAWWDSWDHEIVYVTYLAKHLAHSNHSRNARLIYPRGGAFESNLFLMHGFQPFYKKCLTL